MIESERQRLSAQARFEHEGNNLCRKIEGEQPRVMGEAYALVSPILGVVLIGWDSEPIPRSVVERDE
jgi:hypothetical protein